MNKNIARQIIIVVALAITFVVNILANALPINGQTSAEIANRLPILFVPANYVFSIWGVIYTFLIGYAIYQALPSQRENDRLRSIFVPIIISCIANSGWLLFFHYNQFALSMVLMIALLLSLITIYLRLGIGRTQVSNAERWLTHVPFSIYLAWITVATIANASYVLFDAGWDGFGIAPVIWTVLMLVIATGIVVTLTLRHRDIAYAAVIVWAFVGIVVKQGDTPMVAATAALMIGVVIAALIYARFRMNPSNELQSVMNPA